jgi:phage protein D
VLANSIPLGGVQEARVTSTNHFAADRFSIRVALDAAPGAEAIWANADAIAIEVRMSLDGFSFVSIVQGTVDVVEIDQLRAAATLEGRDLTALFIESRTQETFANRTASEIARLLAGRHGLTPQVTPTTTPVGRYYQDEHDRITLDQFSRATTEWDLLVFLAQQEGFDVFVSGSTLFFQPPSSTADAVQLTPDTLVELRLERSLIFSRDIEVTVKSWNSRQQSAFTQTARSSKPTGGSAGGLAAGPVQRYVFVRPNLTLDQALQLAQRKLAELTRHERVFHATMPGELALSPRSLIALSGTGTAFDQTYFVDVVERSLSVESGFVQHLRCTNMQSGAAATPPADIVAAVTG